MAVAEWFDESLLDDPDALVRGDGVLRQLAEAGARVRREAVESAGPVQAAVAQACSAGMPGWSGRLARTVSAKLGKPGPAVSQMLPVRRVAAQPAGST